eukprot:XP_008663845.1 spidroin-2-like [Zea mays]
MAARLGVSPDRRLGQGSPSQPPGGLAPSVLGAGTLRSRSEEWRQAERVLDPLAEMIGVTPGGQAELHAPKSSKQRQGPAGLAPTKALKTGPTSAAGAAARHAGWLASAQGALRRGAQAARVAMGHASQADPPVGAAIVPGEAADAAAALSPPDLLPALASTPAGAVADSPTGPPVAADVGMVEAPPPVVIPDLPPLRFWSRDTSESLLSLNDELEEKSRDSFREYTEVAVRSLQT